ncbi:PHA/PHB synthase family protein [Alteripontixanthobacter maritimus]
METQAQWMRQLMNGGMFGAMMPGAAGTLPGVDAMQEFAANAARLQAMWTPGGTGASDSSGEDLSDAAAADPAHSAAAAAALADPSKWLAMMEGWTKSVPFADPAVQQSIWSDAAQLWQSVLGGNEQGASSKLPRKDRRFADPRWSSNPIFALIHQTYLLMNERLTQMAGDLDHLPPEKREQVRFATNTMLEALSPANFAATNPVVLERTVETRGANLVKGMEHMMADLKEGKLTHVDRDAFTVGENIAVTPGKVVHETPLYQLIQYSPVTPDVLATPLVIFPPWINRFYILDLNPQKSFIRWAVEQGLTVFVVSWKSADTSMKDVVWDDYIRAEIGAIDHIRSRLKVPSVHTIGYCVAGTTLAAALAILARRGEAEKVASATFFTAQVDFEDAGELLHFVDDNQIQLIEGMAKDGYIDGRVMAATFNMLRGTDLIWNYVVNNYLLGEDYPAFDLLHWNGDVTNLPAKWHSQYLRDLYKDNKLVTPDALQADGTPIDLTQVETPSYIQAGKEDHIAPATSVWRIMDHFQGPMRFVLAGSGHIAGVVNPPAAGKYQYWINEEPEVTSLDQFREGAVEHPGSWWPDWIEWLHSHGTQTVPAKGKRAPGMLKSDQCIEDAPGRYVKSR